MTRPPATNRRAAFAVRAAAAAGLTAAGLLVGRAVVAAQDGPGPQTRPASAPASAPATSPAATLPSTKPATGGRSPDDRSREDRSRDDDRGSLSGRDRDRDRDSDRGRDSDRDRDRDDRSAAATRAADPVVPTFKLPPAKPMDAQYRVLLTRSLFARSRSPSVDGQPRDVRPPDTQRAEVKPESALVLRGLSIEDDGVKYAFVEDLNTRATSRVKVGDRVARGRVAEVTLADLVYDQGGRRNRVAIGFAMDGSVPPAAVYPLPSAPVPGLSSPSQSRSNSGRSDSGRSDSNRSDSGRSDSGRSSSGSPPSPPPSPSGAGAPPAPGTSGGGPATAPASGGGGSVADMLERMRLRRQQEGGK